MIRTNGTILTKKQIITMYLQDYTKGTCTPKKISKMASNEKAFDIKQIRQIFNQIGYDLFEIGDKLLCRMRIADISNGNIYFY